MTDLLDALFAFRWADKADWLHDLLPFVASREFQKLRRGHVSLGRALRRFFLFLDQREQ